MYRAFKMVCNTPSFIYYFLRRLVQDYMYQFHRILHGGRKRGTR